MRLGVTVLVVLLASALCVMAGRWQYGRYVTKADAMDAYDAAQAHAVAEVEEVAPAGSASLDDGAEWRTVTVTGVIEPDSIVALRNRPVDSTAAYQYLAWVTLSDGASVLVNLGWAPVADADDAEAALAAALTDQAVTLTGTLREFDEDDGKRDDGATRIVPAQMTEVPELLVPGYVLVGEPCAGLCDADGPLSEVPLPTLSLGPHLSYAWQWWAFSLLVPVGAVLLTKRDLELKRDPALAKPKPVRTKRRGQPSDEEIEDAL